MVHAACQEAGIGGTDVGYRLQQDFERLPLGRVPIGLDGDCAGSQDQPEQIFGALGVTTEPEHVAEHPRHHRG